MDDDGYLTTVQVAELAGISAAHLRVLLYRGQGPPSIGAAYHRLFPADEARAWARQRQADD